MSKTVIYYIETISGDKIISEVIFDEENKSYITLKNPYRIISYMEDGVLFPSLHPIEFGEYFTSFPMSINSITILKQAGHHLRKIYTRFKKALLEAHKPKENLLH